MRTTKSDTLHPATKLFGTREHPRKVAVTPIAGAKKIDEDTIGELGWYVYLAVGVGGARSGIGRLGR